MVGAVLNSGSQASAHAELTYLVRIVYKRELYRNEVLYSYVQIDKSFIENREHFTPVKIQICRRKKNEDNHNKCSIYVEFLLVKPRRGIVCP
jgi:hypothetical protein